MFRGPRPKLSLSVPTATSMGPASPGSTLSININAALAASALATTPRSPLPPMSAVASCSPLTLTPLTQAARNAVLNQRGFATLQVPSFAYVNNAASKSILKRDIGAASGADKNLRFNEVPKVDCVSPLPPECHGGYTKLSKDERRWRRE